MAQSPVDRWVRRILAAGIPALGLSGCAPYDCGSVWTGHATTEEWRRFEQQAWIELADCRRVCVREPLETEDRNVKTCRLGETEGDIVCEVPNTCYGSQPIPGRRPEGLRELGAFSLDTDAPGAWLARAAWFEAAAVPAFERLGAELRRHGAPESLVERAFGAADEERRHARIMTALAHRFGAETTVPEVGEIPVRSLEAIAIENAVEGCVHETWAALITSFQARSAPELRVRRTFAAIAGDEVGHAQLAWDVDAWLRDELDSEALARMAAARAEAVSRLVEAAATAEAPGAASVLGLPSPATLVFLAAAAAPGMRSGRMGATASERRRSRPPARPAAGPRRRAPARCA